MNGCAAKFNIMQTGSVIAPPVNSAQRVKEGMSKLSKDQHFCILINVDMLVVIVIHHEWGHNRPVSASPNSLFKGLPIVFIHLVYNSALLWVSCCCSFVVVISSTFFGYTDN
jgi:hypothetical protein